MDKKFKLSFNLHANFYKLLGNPRRLEIILLLTQGELTVNEMSKMLGIPQPNISQHLAILRGSGVVATHRDGIKIRYRLVSDKISLAIALIRNVFADQVSGKTTQLDKEIVSIDPANAFEIAVDPVCGMKVNQKTAEGLTRGGKTYYFCASGCRKQFLKGDLSTKKAAQL